MMTKAKTTVWLGDTAQLLLLVSAVWPVALYVLAHVASCVPAALPSQGDPYRKLRDLADVLEMVEGGDGETEPVAETDEFLTASFQPGIPELQTSPVLQATSSPVVLAWEGIHSGSPTVLAQGTNILIADADTGTAEQTIELTEDGIKRTLEQTLLQSAGTLTVFGTLSIEGAGSDRTTLRGGWVFSQADRTQIHPDSEPGFHEAIAQMLHVTGGDETAPPLNLTLVLLANTAVLGTNFLLDALDSERS